jgi:luciferase-like monooxygenase
MRYGFYLPTRGACATPDALETLLTRAEALGFASTMIADHVVFPTRSASPYPYTVSGAFPGGGDALEQLALMAFAAGRTRSLRLVTSVMILPYRNPVLTAKMLATVDVLSRGPAVTVRPRSVAPPATVTGGTPSAPTPRSPSAQRSCAPRSTSCTDSPRRKGATRRS